MSAEAFHLALGAALLLFGHALRAVRHGMMLDRADVAGRSPLAFALFLSYAVNAVVPFRAGDAFRAAYLRLARPEGSRLSLARSCASVAAERTLDAPVVLALLLAASASGVPAAAWGAAFLCALLALSALLFAGLGSPRFRRSAWLCTSPFSPALRLFLVDALWSWATTLRGRGLRSAAFLSISAAMWLLYVAAYAFLSKGAGVGLADLVSLVHAAPLDSVASRASGDAWVLVLPFALVPALVVLALLPLRSVRAVRAASAGLAGRLGSQEAFSRRFSEDAAYRVFLLAHFAGEGEAVAGFGLLAAGQGGGAVRRFLEGGSGAVVAVVDGEGEEEARVRKFAMGEPARRLALQAAWLRNAASSGLPASPVLAERSGQEWAAFDMPLLSPCADASEAIHAMPRARARTLLSEVLDEVRRHHARTARPEEPGARRAYVETKMRDNARVVRDILSRELGESWELNGERFSLRDLDPLLDPDWGMSMMSRDGWACDAHGDLTLENIIVSPAHPRGWFLIDPNPSGPLERPLLDMGKLLQSLHLGYESLSRRGEDAARTGPGRITVPILRSEAYASLHALAREDILRHDGPDGLREASFHELVHWLRLVPYKARAGRMRGLAFASLVPFLLRRHEEEWEGRAKE